MILEFWKNISDRERWLVAVGIVFVLVALVYGLLLRPLLNSHRRLRSEVQEKHLLLEWMVDASLQARQLAAVNRKSLADTTGGPLLTIIDRSARQSGVADGLKRVERGDNDTVRVWLENIPYVDVIGWIRSLAGASGVQAVAVSMDRAQETGYVNARISFGRSGV